MQMDVATLQALNVLESKIDVNKNSILFGLMKRTCTTDMGNRLLNRWLKLALLDVYGITHRSDLVSTFIEDTTLHEYLRQHLKRITDIE